MSQGEAGRTRATQQRSLLARKQILDAAVTVLAEEGYASATTLRIQQVAGVTRGRLLNYFPSRDDLLVASVHHLAAERFAALSERTDWPAAPRERIAAAIETMWATYRQPYFWASMELWLAARAHDELRRALLPLERDLGRMVRESTDSFFGADLTAVDGYAALRELLNTSMRGVALTYALERRDHSRDPHLPEWTRMACGLLTPS